MCTLEGQIFHVSTHQTGGCLYRGVTLDTFDCFLFSFPSQPELLLLYVKFSN